MTITAADIKLLESERMADTTDGGGRRTSRVIADGVAGNIYSKVSRLDSVYGRVNLRKVYAHVDSLNVDTYAGAHAAIIDDADNDKIKVNIFTTGSDFDDRTAARDRIESFVVSGPESRMWLYGRQLAGQQAITCLQRVEDTLPEVGNVFCLSRESDGIITYQQYVRVEDVQHEVRKFTDATGDYERRMVTLKLSATLRYEFVGLEMPSRFSATARQAIIRNTTVADAATYFGISKIAEAVGVGALEVRVDSIFSNLVPTTLRESAVSNAQISGALQVVAAGTAPVDWRYVGANISHTNGAVTGWGREIAIPLGGPIAPGSLQIAMTVLDGDIFEQSGGIVTDDGAGAFTNPIVPGGNGIGVIDGQVDYESGVVLLRYAYSHGAFDGGVMARYIPAAEVGQPAHVRAIPMTLSTRGTVHVMTLNPLPAKGSAFVDFRSMGKWYRLRDDGTGQISGDDPAYGIGTLDMLTGALVVTLGAMPDVGSSVLVGWASPAHFQIFAGASSDADNVVRQKFTLPDLPVKAGTLVVKYTAGAVEYTATADVGGAITGGGVTGKVHHTTGEVELQYATRLPNPAGQLTVNWEQRTPVDPGAPTGASGTANLVGAVTGFATVANVLPHSVSITVPIMLGGALAESRIQVCDDGAGKLFAVNQFIGVNRATYTVPTDIQLGTVNYATGAVTLTDEVFTIRRNWYSWPTGGWTSSYEVSAQMASGAYGWSVSIDAAANDNAKTVSVPLADAPLTLDLTKTSVSEIVPGTVTFKAVGKSYFDRNGTVYHTMAADGTGTAAGTIDYGTGTVTLTNYAQATALSLSVTSCLTKYGDFDVVEATFRTAGSPLRAASTFVQVTAKDGTVLSATCAENGDLVGDFVRGHVNQQFGIVDIEWGEMVTAAGNETQDWYDPDNVVGAEVWKPREVMPGTLRYSTVVLSNLPVDADKLGLDPVRLPTDGRVPILRAGYVVLIHNTKMTNLTNPVVAGGTYAVGRTDLADITLFDTNGTRVLASQYSVDLGAGTVTMAGDMNLGSLVQPLVARHRIEELNMATDAQINGVISLASPTGRAFDEDTKVSGCLLFGDLFARVTNVFDQITWTNVWSNLRIGDNAASEYDTINFPIEVRNDGAVTERWRIHFTGSTTYQVIGENLGVIGTGTTTADCSPVNPLTSKPYFTIRTGGWGGGWGVGQQLRFNTVGATGSIWMARTVLPGAALEGDSIDIQVRGDVDV